ncbi:MAG: sugar ABC transporter permease, partial [Fusicatenibacter saccharivorans]
MKKAEVKKGKKKNVLKEYWPLYLMMLPALLYLLINNYIPMAGMVIAFKKLNFAKGIWASPWAGLKNFKFLFASRDAWVITRNTLLYNVAFILVNMV